MSKDKFFSANKLSQLLGVAGSSVSRWCAEGKILGAWRVGRGTWHIPLATVEGMTKRANGHNNLSNSA